MVPTAGIPDASKGMVSLVKIYTKTGDDGTTGLLGRGRVDKDDPRIDSYGTVDELNAVLGLARALRRARRRRRRPDRPGPGRAFRRRRGPGRSRPQGRFHNAVTEGYATRLEAEIDRLEAELPPLTRFILPGGTSCRVADSTWPGPSAGGPSAWSSISAASRASTSRTT